MNITRSGNIPTEIETFSIALRCTGIHPAEVDVTITIEVTLNRATNNVTELVFRRRKICVDRYVDVKIKNGILYSNNNKMKIKYCQLIALVLIYIGF